MTGTRHTRARAGSVFCYAAFLCMGSMMMVFIGALVFARSEAPSPPPVAVELNAEILAPGGVDPSATVYLSVYHAWAGEGDLRHPLEIIESFETKLGTSTFRFNYPVEGGDGLVVYAWVDTDGDGIHCTPAARRDLADLAEPGEYPSEQVSVSLFLEVPCAGPNWFFPGPPPTGTDRLRPDGADYRMEPRFRAGIYPAMRRSRLEAFLSNLQASERKIIASTSLEDSGKMYQYSGKLMGF